MLPHVAPTTGTAQPTPALPAGGTADAAVKPQLSAAALANLRAEVLLRLIETMLKHMPPAGGTDPGRDLLETLLTLLKSMPGGEGGRKLADIITRLPPELRPSVEKLIGTVLSAMPTRSLVEVLRNPNGPEAQKLANLLTTIRPAETLAGGAAERQQKPVALTAQQLAAVARHDGTQQAGQTPGDARALQTALKRIFDLDSNSKPRALPADTAEADERLPAQNRAAVATGGTARAEPRLPAGRTGGQEPLEAAAATLRHQGSAEELDAPAPLAKRAETPARAQIANAAGQALARGVLQAVTRDMPPERLMQAVAHLMENLSPEEASFLRTLLERPFGPEIEQELAQMVRDQTEDGARTGGKAQPETTHSTHSRPVAEPDKPLPMQQARETAPAVVLAEATPERLVATPMLREGVPLAFVPYLPAEENVEWPEPGEAEQDEASEDNPGENKGEDGGGEAQAEAEGDAAGEEPESPDMARRREKTAEMVGVLEPGLVFYRKLGDYWA